MLGTVVNGILFILKQALAVVLALILRFDALIRSKKRDADKRRQSIQEEEEKGAQSRKKRNRGRRKSASKKTSSEGGKAALQAKDTTGHAAAREPVAKAAFKSANPTPAEAISELRAKAAAQVNTDLPEYAAARDSKKEKVKAPPQRVILSLVTPREDPAFKEIHSRKPSRFAVGDVVDARYQQGYKWFRGTVSKVRYGGGLDIDYDDGERETKVLDEMVRFARTGQEEEEEEEDVGGIEAHDIWGQQISKKQQQQQLAYGRMSTAPSANSAVEVWDVVTKPVKKTGPQRAAGREERATNEKNRRKREKKREKELAMREYQRKTL
ncbi:unnamed protein product [Chrysoparadoxa australica]